MLVGHSYGGMVITGVADRIPERLRALIYVDAFLPESGESVARLNGAQFAPFIAQNTKDGMIHAPWVSPGSAIPKDVPQPLKTFTDTLLLSNPAALRLPAVTSYGRREPQRTISRRSASGKARGRPVHE